MRDRHKKWRNNEPVILASSHDFRVFATQIHPFWTVLPRQVELQLPFISTTKQQSWHNRIQRHMRACGCFTGAVCTLLALAYYIAAEFNYAGGLDGNGWRSILVAASVVVMSGFCGKMVALVLSRMLLKRDIKQLLSVVEQESKTI